MFLQILFLGSIFAHVCPSKLLVSTGAQYDDKGQISEVIDLLDPETICEPLPDYPVNIEDAFGGLLHGNIPMICGGQSRSGFYQNMQCHTISSNSISIDLITVRTYSAGISVHDDNQFWITGGYNFQFDYSTELISLDQPSKLGPILPQGFAYHCMAKMGENNVILTGGYANNGNTLLVDTTNNFTMTAGPKLLKDRYNHGCGMFELDGKNFVIVAGGDSGFTSLTDSEILEAGSNQWIQGPSLPTTCRFPSMVTNPDGDGVILLGCYENQDTLYELKNLDGILTWKEMPQKLKYPRHSTVAMLIPDDLANCE